MIDSLLTLPCRRLWQPAPWPRSVLRVRAACTAVPPVSLLIHLLACDVVSCLPSAPRRRTPAGMQDVTGLLRVLCGSINAVRRLRTRFHCILMNCQIYELLTADGARRGGEGARDGRQGGARTTAAGLQQQLGAVAGRRVCTRRLVWSGRGAVSIDTLQLACSHHSASVRP